MQDPGGGGSGYDRQVDVDISKLESAIPWLNGLHDYILNNLLDQLSNVSRAIKNDPLAFGTFPNAVTAAQKHRQYLETVAQGYHGVAQRLANIASATRTIIDNYDTVEERNTATSADIERILGGGGSAPSTGTTTPVTNTSTTPSGSDNASRGY